MLSEAKHLLYLTENKQSRSFASLRMTPCEGVFQQPANRITSGMFVLTPSRRELQAESKLRTCGRTSFIRCDGGFLRRLSEASQRPIVAHRSTGAPACGKGALPVIFHGQDGQNEKAHGRDGHATTRASTKVSRSARTQILQGEHLRQPRMRHPRGA